MTKFCCKIALKHMPSIAKKRHSKDLMLSQIG